MSRFTHTFIETYDDLMGFGQDRETDENTLICYLQMFSDDALMKTLVKRMSDAEIELLFEALGRLLKTHLSEPEYHSLFLKDNQHLP